MVGQRDDFQSGYFDAEGARGKQGRDERTNKKPVATGIIE